MSDFPKFAAAVKARFEKLSQHELFTVNLLRDELFETYLNSFPEGTNPIFRVRTTHDGSYDRAFIRNIGHLVAIVNDKIETLWDIPGLPAPYDVVAKALHELVKVRAITGVFRTKERFFGHEPNVELIDGKSHRFTHFEAFVAARHFNRSPAEAAGSINTSLGVFKRGVEELTIGALNTVVDLIKSNAIYRGQEYAGAVSAFYKLKTDYDAAPNKNQFLWANISHGSGASGRITPAACFRNTVIGTLVTDLSDGVELEKAVRSFEAKVAPEHYKRTTALITQKMVDQAVDKLKELGLESAVERRFAKISDVSVNNVLFVDNSVRGQMKDGLAGLLMSSVKPTQVNIKNATPISIDDFLKTIVPQASSIDLLVENKHLGNFVSLTAPAHDNTGRLFKWNNDFAWAYDGDVTDSIKQRVKTAGGNVDATLRVSLAWFNTDDLDLHGYTPNGDHVYYGVKRSSSGHVHLDVDMNVSRLVRDPVENIAVTGKLIDGEYRFKVNQFTKRENIDTGYTVEIEHNGVIHQLQAKNHVGGMGNNSVTLTVKGGEIVNIAHSAAMSSAAASKDKWGIKTQTLVPVDTLLTSPNFWDDQQIGNKHWFFILKGALNPEPVRGIYNEFLRNELEPHRKVFEILGAKTKTRQSDEQLSGLGFSSTRKDGATVVVKGDKINKAFQISF